MFLMYTIFNKLEHMLLMKRAISATLTLTFYWWAHDPPTYPHSFTTINTAVQKLQTCKHTYSQLRITR